MHEDARSIKNKSRIRHLFVGLFCIRIFQNVPYLTRRKLATGYPFLETHFASFASVCF